MLYSSRSIAALLAAACLIVVSQVQAAQLPLVGTGSGLAQGQLDPNWTVVLPDGTSFGPAISATDPNNGWFIPPPPETWISVAARDFIAPGVYKYSTTFNIGAGNDPSTAVISGNWWADDLLPSNSILLNGVQVSDFDGAIYNDPNPADAFFSINSGFVSGLNTLTFVVENGGGPGGTFVRLSGTVRGSSVPDSGSTASLVLFGLIGLAAMSKTFSQEARQQIR